VIDELGRLIRFGLVGVTNTLLTIAVFALLTGKGVAPAAASALAFAVGAANGYRLNRRWTFRVAESSTTQVARYVAVQALGAGLSAGGVALVGGDLSVRRLAAEAMVLPVVTAITYILSRVLVFGGPRPA
jgi:putative flippase GtrA